MTEIVFAGGPIFTGTGAPVHGQGVWVRDGRIVAIAPEADIADLAPDATRVDLRGALLSPGFQDAHIHAVGGGVELLQCNLTEAESAAEAVELVRAYAAAHPDELWIVGGGWSMDHFPGGAPVRALLDEAAPGRAVLLLSRDHHSTWASTTAIDLAGLDQTTPDPADGRIEREPDGFPAGTFHEGAGDLFEGIRPATDADLVYRGHHRMAGCHGRHGHRGNLRPSARL
mgnify:CR=1 FL=1